MALSWSASGVRSHPRLAWRSQSVAGIGKLEFESRASPTKLSTPSRAVVSGGVMERALVLDSSPDEASRRSLTNVSWHGASRNSKYHIDVEALARQAASAVPSDKTRPSPAPLPAAMGKEQSSSTARAVAANSIQEQEHSQRAAAAGADLAEALGDEFVQARELGVTVVGPEVSQIRGGLIPGYQLERYQQIQMREKQHELVYEATDTMLRAHLHSPDQTPAGHLVTASSSSAPRVGSPGRTGSSSIPGGIRWPGGMSPSRTRTTPPRTYSSAGRSSPGRSSPGRSSPGRSVSGNYGGGDDQLARRLDMSAGPSGPSSFAHGSLSTPRRPGTTLSATGRLNPMLSSAATVAESMPAATASAYGGAVEQPQPRRSMIAALPPRDKSSSSVRSTLWTGGISGELERHELGTGVSPTRTRQLAVRLVASSPPRSTSSLSPGRSARLRESSKLAGRPSGFSSPVRSRSSAAAARIPSSPKGRSGAFDETASFALEVDPTLTNMAASEHDRAAMDADLRFREALQNLEVRD